MNQDFKDTQREKIPNHANGKPNADRAVKNALEILENTSSDLDDSEHFDDTFMEKLDEEVEEEATIFSLKKSWMLTLLESLEVWLLFLLSPL